MREVNSTTRFDRDYARLYQEGLVDPDDFQHFAYLLAKRDELPPEYGEHPLTDNWEGYQDAHLAGDVVVIFKRFRREVRLHRIARHEDLFPSRRRKSKGLKKPEPTFDQVLERALADTSRKLKRWWHRQR
jgi:addiction module RelE/StbE family toxin